MTRIDIDDRLAARLKEQAAARHLTIEQLIDLFSRDVGEFQDLQQINLEDLDRVLDELATDDEGLPVLPSDFSRADIYLDHD